MIYEIILTRLYKSISSESFISYYTTDKQELYGVLHYLVETIMFHNDSPIHDFNLNIIDRNFNTIATMKIDDHILNNKELFDDKFLMEFKLANGCNISGIDIYSEYAKKYNSCDCLPVDNKERFSYYDDILKVMSDDNDL